jgi:hypothetical protein
MYIGEIPIADNRVCRYETNKQAAGTKVRLQVRGKEGERDVTLILADLI